MMLSLTDEEATGTRIIIQATSIRGDRRQRYRVRFQDAVLIEETWCPEFEACRLLFARGFTGKLEVWRTTLPYACMTMDIEKAALLTVSDTASAGPRLVKWVPLPERGVANAVSRYEGSPGKRKIASRGSEHLPTETPVGWVG